MKAVNPKDRVLEIIWDGEEKGWWLTSKTDEPTFIPFETVADSMPQMLTKAHEILMKDLAGLLRASDASHRGHRTRVARAKVGA